jgi:hypothetical protein
MKGQWVQELLHWLEMHAGVGVNWYVREIRNRLIVIFWWDDNVTNSTQISQLTSTGHF